jgi:hypothetical protein
MRIDVALPTMAPQPKRPWWKLDSVETLRLQFVEAVRVLTVDDWASIARRYVQNESALDAKRARLAKVNSDCGQLLMAASEAVREKALVFLRWEHAMLKSVVEALPEVFGSESLPLRPWALAAGRAAQTVLRFADDKVRAKDKVQLMALGLHPFQGHVPLPPMPGLAAEAVLTAPVASRPATAPSVAGDGRVLHFIFPREYIEGHGAPAPGDRKHHETWRLPVASLPAAGFGGTGKGSCAVCGGKLHRLVELPPLLALPAGAETGLSLFSCLSCLGWTAPFLHFKHEGNAKPTPIGHTGPRKKPEFPARGLRATKVRFAATPKRWTKQAWAGADCQNLHRIGGAPSWVENAETVKCPDCGRRMLFLLQLGSGLPAAEGERWLWGSGGVLYVFWCGKCRIDTQFWQCS